MKLSKRNKLVAAFLIASECDNVPSKERFYVDKDLLDTLSQYIVPYLTKKQIIKVCTEFSNRSAVDIKKTFMSEIPLTEEQKSKLVKFDAADMIQFSFRYIPEYSELKKEMNKKPAHTKVIKEKYTEEILKDVCDSFSGLHSYEVESRKNIILKIKQFDDETSS